MADEPISALTLFTSYSTADEVEILDVSDTTFASTGTNKRIPFSTLLTMAGVGSGTGGGSGTVTSVGLSLPPFITVTGSPVSTSGTLTGTLATQTANTHFAGPTSGSAAAPTFRALVAADLPVFVASGSSHAPGAVPDPGSTAGSTRYLREDATWDVPPSSGLTTGGAVTGGAANAILYENSSSNLAASSALTFNGTNTVSTTATALILQQTGDTTGTSYLQLCNRANSNGAIFKNSAIQLVDFAFQDSAGNQNNLRSGSGSTFTHGYGNTSGELNLMVNTLGTPANVFFAGAGSVQFTTGRVSVGLSLGTQPVGALHAVAPAVGAPCIVADALASQTAPIQEWRSSTPTVLAQVTAAGELNGPIAPIYTALTTTATATAQQSLIAVSAASAWTLTLPAAAGVQAGHEFVIKKTDSNTNTITVAAAGSDKIDGAATYDEPVGSVQVPAYQLGRRGQLDDHREQLTKQ